MKTKLNGTMFGPLSLLIAQYTSQIVWPFVNLLVVRYLGTEEFGWYASAIAIITLLSLLPDFGLQQAALNLNARRQYRLSSILSKSLSLGLLYALIAFIIIVLWVLFVPLKVEIKWLSLLLGANFFKISLVTVVTTGLQVQGKYSRIAFWNLVISLSQWVSTLLFMLAGAGLYTLISGPILISFACAVIMITFQSNSLFRRKVDYSDADGAIAVPVKELVRGSWRFGLAASMHQLYYKSDTAVLSVSRTPVEVGYYTVAFKLIELFFLFPGVLFNQVLYPKYCIWCRENIPKLKVYYHIMNKLMILSGMIVTFLLLFFSGEILMLLFGENHSEAAVFLSLLALAVPLRFWVSSIGAVLTNEKLIAVKLKIQTGTALLNVLLNILFIPSFGGIAAATNMIGTHILLVGAYGYAARKYLFGFGRFELKKWLFPLGLVSIDFFLYVLAENQGFYMKLTADTLIAISIILGSIIWFESSEKKYIVSLIRKDNSVRPINPH